MREEKIKLIDLQIKGSFVIIATVIVFILLNYDLKQKFLDKKPLFTDEEAKNIIIINRVVVLIVTLLFLYVNYKDYQLVIKYNQTNQLRGAKLQIDAAILQIIAAIIILYVVVNEYNFPLSVTAIENP